MDTILPKGKVIHITVSASSIKSFTSSNLIQRDCITCFRCAEQGHWKSECMLYKTRLCWHEKIGTCTDSDCPFAHSESELRTPWKPKCIRVVKREGKLIKLGCGSSMHTFRQCPNNQENMCEPCS